MGGAALRSANAFLRGRRAPDSTVIQSVRYLFPSKQAAEAFPREIERFGRDYLLAAPAHEVKLLDEEALARLNDYLLAHPRAGVLM